MISWLRRYQRPFFVGTIAIFLIGTFVGLGGYFFTRSDVSEAVAVVGATKIPYMRYRIRVDQYLEALREGKQEVTEESARRIKDEMLREMIVDELLSQQAEAMGLKVTDLELKLSIENTPRFQRDGRFDQALYFQAVRYGLRTTPEDFERQQRKAMLSAKIKNLIFSSAKLMPSELRDEYLRLKKGSEKDYEKQKDSFAAELQQIRALDLINAFLRSVSQGMDIRNFLEQREQGL